jgi:Barstar (barnase inhibitor)
MPVVRLDTRRISDWDSFHSVFAEVFGFPAFYGRNMNAWIDCIDYLDVPGAAMSSIIVEPGDVLTLQLDEVDSFATRCPEQFEALIDCAAFVNWRRCSQGEGAVLALAFHKSEQLLSAPSGPRD